MIIRRLTLHNFGVYAGQNEFLFSGKKPVVLIGGLNGRGKTTFLNAILLSLFGENSIAYKESKYHTYGRYLQSFVNSSDRTYFTYVEIEFLMDNFSTDKYIVHREWDGSKQRTSEIISVYKNGEKDSFLTDNWDMYIENNIPSALSSFFFFDGEQIANLAVDETNEQIKDSIKSLLGINVIDTVQKDLGRVERNVSKTLGAKLNQAEADRLLNAVNTAKSALTEQDKKIELAKKELQDTAQKLEEAELKYRSLGGEAYEKEADNRARKEKLQAEVKQYDQNLLNIASGVLPMALVPELIDAIDLQSRREATSEINKIAAQQVSQYAEKYGTDESVEKFVRYIQNQAAKDQVKTIYGLTPSSKLGVHQLNSSLLEQSVLEAKKAIRDRNSKLKKLSETENYLSLDLDGKKLGKISALKKSLGVRKSELEASLITMDAERRNLHGIEIKALSEYNSFIENELNTISTSADSERILKYTNLLNKVFDQYKVKLQENKLSVLADTITKCYKKLANKKNLIDKIAIDPQTLDFSYYDKNKNIISNSSLSAGEKQMMVLCILWGLAICSKKKLPVIIDTPLGRMDSDNRKSLIKKYFPNASDQTIILSTDTEINREYYEMMKSSIGDEYTLIYDDSTNSTSIQKGYLFENEG